MSTMSSLIVHLVSVSGVHDDLSSLRLKLSGASGANSGVGLGVINEEAGEVIHSRVAHSADLAFPANPDLSVGFNIYMPRLDKSAGFEVGKCGSALDEDSKGMGMLDSVVHDVDETLRGNVRQV